jgi:hypothetical protein
MVARNLVVLAVCTVVVAVVLSAGAAWGVTSLASTRTPIAGTAGTSGASGKTGTAGKTGAAGANGTIGVAGENGSDGAAGARGPAGAQGSAGGQGPVGPTGASGASAPTFSAISASGLTFPNGVAFTYPTQTAAVPAGPALVGFSVGLQTIGPNFPVTCSLVDANDPTTVFATTASLLPGNAPAYSTYAATQVVNLTVPTVLTVQCIMSPPFPQPMQYQSLSVYAISFAS